LKYASCAAAWCGVSAIAAGVAIVSVNIKGENMNIDQVIQYAGYAVAVLTAIISVYRSYKQGKTAGEVITVLVNVLKDEAKMIDGKFSAETLEKAEEVARTISANDAAVEQAKAALKGKELDVKIGSYKGKPIYLSDAIGAGGLLRKIKKVF
jgi:hypothetical protein